LSTKTPIEDANGDASTSRTSHDFFEVAPEPAPDPEAGTPHRGISEGTDEAAVPEDEPRAEAGESVGTNDTIQDQWEVLSMARELFGPGEGTSGDKESRGG
jgi:hypothetical protein